jgi:hypothetical protein
MSRRRYVFDTNTVVSAFLFGPSTPGRALEAARQRGRLLLSDDTARELNEVLDREKFDEYVRRETRREFVVALVDEATFVEPTEQIERCRDPDDDKFLELAVAGNATAIVSGDDDLLVLETFRDIPILTAKEFLRRIERGNT